MTKNLMIVRTGKKRLFHMDKLLPPFVKGYSNYVVTIHWLFGNLSEFLLLTYNPLTDISSLVI